MEIGEYLTNVVSVSDLASVHYYYLETPTNNSELRRRCLSIEATWRQCGALVVTDKDRSGIWLFGKSNSDMSLPPPSVSIGPGGIVESGDIKLEIKKAGTYEPSSLWKLPKQAALSSSSQISGSSPAISTENNVRNGSAVTAKISPSNTALGINQESITVANPIQGEFTSAERAVEPRDIQEHFISAVLATLSYRLCHEGKFIALNARTLVLPISSFSKIPEVFSLAVEQNICQKRVLMISLDVQLTSLGTLILKASLDISSDISCIRHPLGLSLAFGPIAEGTDLFLAPSGKVARYYGLIKEEEHGQDVSKTETEFTKEQYLNTDSITNFAIHRWKMRCINWLQKKGIHEELLENCSWIMVEIFTGTNSFDRSDATEGGLWTPEEKIVTIPWPSALCFRRGTHEDLKKAVPNMFRGYDPLSFAEKWFSSGVERDVIIAKRQKGRDSAAATLRAQAEADTRNLTTSSSHSPIVLRRPSNAGAVYPTPPDGIQHLVGATPSFNDSASTPGIVNQQPPHADQDQIAGARNEIEDTDGNLWGANTVKRDRISGLDFNDSGNDNFFGDLGGDLFGENDVTDADFNFFDEPDGLENTRDKISVDENMDDAAQEPKSDTMFSTYGKILGDTTNLAAVPDSLMIEADSGILEKQDIKHNQSLGHTLQTNKDLSLEHAATSSLLYDNVPRPPSPPLSPGFVFKRLSTAGITTKRRDSPVMLEKTISAFGSVEFDSSLSIFNEKYGSRGRFICPSIPKTATQSPSNALPSTGYLRKRRMLRPNAVDLVDQALRSPLELPPEPEINGSQSDSESQSRSPSESPAPDQDDNIAEAEVEILVPGVKRKRETDDANEEDEMASSLKDLNVSDSPPVHNVEPLDLLDPSFLDWDFADWSLSSFFACPEPRNATSILTDTEYIASAQLLADQAIFRTLKVPMLTNQDETGEGPDNCAYRNSAVNLVQQTFAQVVKAIFDQATECNIVMFTEVQDMPPFGQINRLTPRLMPNPRAQYPELAKPSSMFPIPAPHIEVRRAESRLAVLPSAAPFWENLGLAPCKGSKDVSAICIYPEGEGMTEGVNAFLDHTRSAYESGRFGTHERFCHSDVPNGLFPIDFGESDTLSVADHQALLIRIKDTATRVGSLLISGSTEGNIVIYYIYDSTNPELLVPICSAFQDLFTIYKTGLSEEKNMVADKIVLQFIPLDFVASHSAFVVPRPSEYSRLAMEVYDRCVDQISGTSSPSIVLEQSLPRSIDFKMTPNPSASLLQENSCMHIAYAQSIDDRWITAAWTDSTGSQQMTASYCLGRKGVPLTTSFFDIAHEIWETTLDVIASRKVHWRILICKCGVMEPSEIDSWKDLASSKLNAQVSLTLVTADTNPSLNLLPLSVSLPQNTLTSQPIFYTTPVSTPSASMVSPEQSGNANTPARDPGTTNATTPGDSNLELKIDVDATLVDVRDQTWGVVLSHRLNNSRSLLEFHPALVSGYLIKRTGAAASDAPVAMEVNVVHSEANPRMYDTLLREILGHYRGLGTLARVRGCVDPVMDCRPWHVAAAEKGVRVLYMLM